MNVGDRIMVDNIMQRIDHEDKLHVLFMRTDPVWVVYLGDSVVYEGVFYETCNWDGDRGERMLRMTESHQVSVVQPIDPRNPQRYRKPFYVKRLESKE